MSARHEAEGLKYGLAETAKAPETLELSRSGPGQRNPQHCPQLPGGNHSSVSPGSLGSSAQSTVMPLGLVDAE